MAERKVDWFGILEAARRTYPPGAQFTAPHLAELLRLPSVQIASAWLYKFQKWGYVEVVDRVKGNAIRPLNVYKITAKGKACKPRAGRELQLRQLIDGIRALQKVRKTAREEAAYQALVKLCDEVES